MADFRELNVDEEKKIHPLVIELARIMHEEAGKLEIDDDAKVSHGTENGAYVQAWVWVDFTDDLKLDKENPLN